MTQLHKCRTRKCRKIFAIAEDPDFALLDCFDAHRLQQGALHMTSGYWNCVEGYERICAASIGDGVCPIDTQRVDEFSFQQWSITKMRGLLRLFRTLPHRIRIQLSQKDFRRSPASWITAVQQVLRQRGILASIHLNFIGSWGFEVVETAADASSGNARIAEYIVQQLNLREYRSQIRAHMRLIVEPT